MNINRSSYVKWFKHKDTENQYQAYREDIYPLIQECHEKHNSYGYHMIAAYIRDHSDWSTQAPLEKISSDMTCIKHRETLYDVVLYLDVFNNEILSYAYIDQHNSSIPYYEGLEKLLIKLKGIETQTILHTDQGSTYSSKVYNHTYKNYNIIRSMSRAGTPTDNPIIESINGWIKAEIDCDWDIDSYETFEEFIEEYIYYYNHQRYASSLHYKTPVQYRIDLGF